MSTSGVSIYFEAYLYNSANCASTPWHLPPMHMSSSQRRPSTAVEEEDEDSPSECLTPEKVKKPKKVYCYVSPKVGTPVCALKSPLLEPARNWYLATKATKQSENQGPEHCRVEFLEY